MRTRAPLAATLLLLAPHTVQACAVCGGGNPANRFAFFASTIALSLLPLGMFVGAGLWLRSRLRRHWPDEFAERDVSGTAADSPAGALQAPAASPGR